MRLKKNPQEKCKNMDFQPKEGWRRIQRKGEPDRVVLYAPIDLRDEILEEAHGAALTGHSGQLKTKECILQSYFWPGMDQDIMTHIKTCHQCQVRRKYDTTKPVL